MPSGSSCTSCRATARSYSPVELLNNDVKAGAAGRRRARTVVELTGELRAYVRGRQRQPEVVARFFQYPDTCYAGAQ
jgi:hypothetical protein